MVRALAGLAAIAVVAVVVLSGSDDGVEAQTCGLEPFSFDTYEVFDNAGLYLAAIELAAAGQVVTSATTPSGAPHELEYPGLLRGTRAERLARLWWRIIFITDKYANPLFIGMAWPAPI